MKAGVEYKGEYTEKYPAREWDRRQSISGKFSVEEVLCCSLLIPYLQVTVKWSLDPCGVRMRTGRVGRGPGRVQESLLFLMFPYPKSEIWVTSGGSSNRCVCS